MCHSYTYVFFLELLHARDHVRLSYRFLVAQGPSTATTSLDELDPEESDSSAEIDDEKLFGKVGTGRQQQYEAGRWTWKNGELVRASEDEVSATASSSKAASAVTAGDEFDSYWKVQALWDVPWPEKKDDAKLKEKSKEPVEEWWAWGGVQAEARDWRTSEAKRDSSKNGDVWPGVQAEARDWNVVWEGVQAESRESRATNRDSDKKEDDVWQRLRRPETIDQVSEARDHPIVAQTNSWWWDGSWDDSWSSWWGDWPEGENSGKNKKQSKEDREEQMRKDELEKKRELTQRMFVIRDI